MEAIANTSKVVAKGDGANLCSHPSADLDQRKTTEGFEVELVHNKAGGACITQEDLDSQKTGKLLIDVTSSLIETYINYIGESLEVDDTDQGQNEMELDLPATGGYKEDNWKLSVGNQVIKIKKPKDPVADLKEMGKEIDMGSLNEEKENVYNAMLEEFAGEDK